VAEHVGPAVVNGDPRSLTNTKSDTSLSPEPSGGGGQTCSAAILTKTRRGRSRGPPAFPFRLLPVLPPQLAAFCPSTRYTDARPILSALAISVGLMPPAFSSRTCETSIDGGRPL
jgi:hypothetical protein